LLCDGKLQNNNGWECGEGVELIGDDLEIKKHINPNNDRVILLNGWVDFEFRLNMWNDVGDAGDFAIYGENIENDIYLILAKYLIGGNDKRMYNNRIGIVNELRVNCKNFYHGLSG
jgi:hypothetical protein